MPDLGHDVKDFKVYTWRKISGSLWIRNLQVWISIVVATNGVTFLILCSPSLTEIPSVGEYF